LGEFGVRLAVELVVWIFLGSARSNARGARLRRALLRFMLLLALYASAWRLAAAAFAHST
jgi:hypothetical protein